MAAGSPRMVFSFSSSSPISDPPLRRSSIRTARTPPPAGAGAPPAPPPPWCSSADSSCPSAGRRPPVRRPEPPAGPRRSASAWRPASERPRTGPGGQWPVGACPGPPPFGRRRAVWNVDPAYPIHSYSNVPFQYMRRDR
ncbi:hypothetical protein B5F19_09085 [Pseudoflavonifractor sp. An184]|nr:hypothetical protein B5F19_09085 [Pseudoflavonifractor sp. An184]